MSKRRQAERRQGGHGASTRGGQARGAPALASRSAPPRAQARGGRGGGSTADRRPIILGGIVVSFVAVVAVVFLVRPGGGAAGPWARLGTEDVHSLAFVADDPQRLLFGHHGGILATDDGGRTWEALGTDADAMGLGAAGTDSIIIAGHYVLIESRDAGHSWAPIAADLPDLDIHGFTRDPVDADRLWAYLAIGGLWESRDAGLTWERVNEGNIVHPVAVATALGTRLYGVTTQGPARSDDGGRTWIVVGSPGIFPLAAMAATPDGSVIVAAGPDGIARSDDGGATWRMLPFDGEPASVAVARGGASIAVVTRSTEFYRSDDGGETWPGP